MCQKMSSYCVFRLNNTLVSVVRWDGMSVFPVSFGGPPNKKRSAMEYVGEAVNSYSLDDL